MAYLYGKSNGESLYSHTLKVLEGIKRFKSLISKSNELFSEDFWKYLEYAAIIHDWGKASCQFQDYMKELIEKKETKNKKTTKKLNVEDLNPHSLLSPIFFNWFNIDITDEWREIILSSVVFHHDRSKIYNLLSEGNIPKVRDEELKSLKREMETLLVEYDNILVKNIKSLNYRFVKFLIPPRNVFIKDTLSDESSENIVQNQRYIIFKGLLHRSDHFVSSMDKNEIDVSSIEIEQAPVEKTEDAVLNEINEKLQGKNRETKKRQEIWQFMEIEKRRGENTVLIGSTGIGKTEFAFLWGSNRKLFFTLPMRTMTDQIFDRSIKIFGENSCGLLHGSAISSLPDILNIKLDVETSDLSSHVSLARSLSYPSIVSTGDQILNISLKYPGYEKIMSTLAYSNLIIDEIQAYDPDTSAIIVKTVEEVVKIGGRFLIMTATLPSYIRDAIEERTGLTQKNFFCIKSKNGISNPEKNRIILLQNGNKKSSQDEKGEPTKEITFNCFEKKVIEIFKKHKGRKILVTINTVKNSQKLYNHITEQDNNFLTDLNLKKKNVMLIHSRFSGLERTNKVERITGKNDKDIKILITTQVIEASIDIDYDILISELAPLDSLIQRMGRVNRNRENYSEGIGDVFVIDGYLPGSTSVYKVYTLNLTAKLLSEENLKGKVVNEEQKQKLLDRYYEHEDYKKITEKFQKNLYAMDNLLLATSKSEAQRIFREISTVTIIPFEEYKNFEGNMIQLEDELKKTDVEKEFNVAYEKKIRTNIKIKIIKSILDHSFSIQLIDFYRSNQVPLWTYLLDNNEFPNINKKVRLKEFLKGYFVIKDKKWKYNSDIGFHQVIKENSNIQ